MFTFNFAATLILREIDFGYFEAHKTAILSILAASKMVKIAVFDLLKQPKLISRKIRVAGKLLNFHIVQFLTLEFQNY